MADGTGRVGRVMTRGGARVGPGGANQIDRPEYIWANMKL